MHVLGGLIKNPRLLIDLSSRITSEDFYVEQHRVMYNVLEKLVFSKQDVDKIILAQKITELGITFRNDVSIFDYIENLAMSQINDSGTIDAAAELSNLRIKRDICETADKIKAYVHGSKDTPLEEVIATSDALYNDKIQSFQYASEPIDIFEGMNDLIEERGNNPVDEIGFLTPYPEYNRLFGGLRNGNLYAIVSRAGQGKTTWIDDLCFGVAKLSRFQIPVLVLDTEMFTQDITLRIAAAISNVPFWYLDTGNWRKNAEFFQLWRDTAKKIKEGQYTYKHMHVANRDISQIEAIIKRWYFTKVGRGNPALIAYDYIKLAGESVAKNWAEHQAIGEKIDRLKRLTEQLNCPLITAMQMNRSGENMNKNSKDITDDSSAIALSDRLQWWASYVGIFRTKTIDEIEDDGMNFGTHKLRSTKFRFQGKEAAGHQDLLIRTTSEGKKKYVANYINYEVKNFHVEEKGSLIHVIKHNNMKYNLNQSKEEAPQNDAKLK